MNPNTDDPDADDPDAYDNDAAYPYSLQNRKNKKNNINPNTDTPNNCAINAADDDDSYPNSKTYIPLLNVKLTPSQLLNQNK